VGGKFNPHVVGQLLKVKETPMKKQFDGLTVTIPAFDNYNGRKDIKKCSWLRLENAISTSEAMFGLDAAERYVFVEILCRASEKQKSEVRINVEYLSLRAAATTAQVCSAISKLIANGTFVIRDQIRTNPDGSVRTEEDPVQIRSESEGHRTDLALTNERTGRTDVTNETNGTGPHERIRPHRIVNTVDKSTPGVNEVIRAYCDGWKARYNSPRSPDITSKSVGLLKRLVSDLGQPRVLKLIDAYLAMPDSWFVTKRHDVATLQASLNSIALFADSGRIISKAETRQIDQAVSTQNTLFALRAGEV
jgi:hypothetical protein